MTNIESHSDSEQIDSQKLGDNLAALEQLKDRKYPNDFKEYLKTNNPKLASAIENADIKNQDPQNMRNLDTLSRGLDNLLSEKPKLGFGDLHQLDDKLVKEQAEHSEFAKQLGLDYKKDVLGYKHDPIVEGFHLTNLWDGKQPGVLHQAQSQMLDVAGRTQNGSEDYIEAMAIYNDINDLDKVLSSVRDRIDNSPIGERNSLLLIEAALEDAQVGKKAELVGRARILIDKEENRPSDFPEKKAREFLQGMLTNPLSQYYDTVANHETGQLRSTSDETVIVEVAEAKLIADGFAELDKSTAINKGDESKEQVNKRAGLLERTRMLATLVNPTLQENENYHDQLRYRGI